MYFQPTMLALYYATLLMFFDRPLLGKTIATSRKKRLMRRRGATSRTWMKKRTTGRKEKRKKKRRRRRRRRSKWCRCVTVDIAGDCC